MEKGKLVKITLQLIPDSLIEKISIKLIDSIMSSKKVGSEERTFIRNGMDIMIGEINARKNQTNTKATIDTQIVKLKALFDSGLAMYRARRTVN